MLAELLQAAPGMVGRATAIDWAVIAGILTVIGGVIVRVIIPGWLHIKSLQEPSGGQTTIYRTGNGNGAEGEWRGRTSEQLNQQDKLLSELVRGTTAVEKLLGEVVRRTEGTEEAIRTIIGMAPKLDTVLAITKKRQAKRKI